MPFFKQKKRDILTKTPKFYLFDTGVLNQLSQQWVNNLTGPVAGKLFEHWVLMELIANRGYQEKDYLIQYWRTKTGLEVDFILGNAEIAIEVKLSKEVRSPELRDLRAFLAEHPSVRAYVVSFDPDIRIINNNITILPWQVFSRKLWGNEL